MGDLLGALLIFAAGILVLALIIYILIAIFLNKLNKLIYGKGTAMAWIPIANVYLLGKLTVNKLVGWLLIICFFSTGTVTTTVNGVETTNSILPEKIRWLVSSALSIGIFVLFIYAIVKYIRLKKEKRRGEFVNISKNDYYDQQEVTQQVNFQSVESHPGIESSSISEVNEESHQQTVVNNQKKDSISQVKPIDIPFENTDI